MKLLLDTHIWLWLNLSPEKLSKSVRRQLDNPATEIYLSPISVWEAGHVVRGGRVRLKEPFPQWVRKALEIAPIREAPFNIVIATEAIGIRLPQSDFGDIMLAATASVLDLTLVTSDPQFVDCSWLKTLAN